MNPVCTCVRNSVYVVFVQCKSASLLVSGILHVRWRGLITQAIHNRYFIDINYYKINSNKNIDNP